MSSLFNIATGLLILFLATIVFFAIVCKFRISDPIMEEILPFLIYLDGEPMFNRERVEASDMAVLAGGANRYEHAFHLPLLALEKNWTYSRILSSWENRPVDIFMRTSNCVPSRLRLMSEICNVAHDQGLIVATGGKCDVSCKKPTYTFKFDKDQNGDWGECVECENSKVVLALENFSEGYIYLSEKPFLPLEMGALGVYIGNGIDLLQDAGVNVEDKFLFVGSSYDTNQAHAIVQVVKDVVMKPEEAIRRMKAPAFKGKTTLTKEALNIKKIQDFCTRHPKLDKIRNLDNINLFVGPAYELAQPFKDPAWMKTILQFPGIISKVNDRLQAHIIVENL